MASPAPYDSPIKAQDILVRSLLDIGAHSRGASLDPDVAQEGLERLNGMIAGWANQGNTIPFVQRQVFPLVANKGGPGWPYTIGVGGDFSVYRPLALEGAGILLGGIPPQAITSITRVLNVATVTTTAPHTFQTGYEVTIQGAVQTAYNGEFTITVTGASTFTFAVLGAPVTPATGTMTVRSEANAGSPVEIPRAVITDEMFQGNQLKNLSSGLASWVYYNQSYGGNLGAIVLWPVPNVSTDSLVLYWLQQVAGFQDLITDYTFPPGYVEAFEYNLAIKWAPAMGRSPNDYPDVRQFAVDSMKWIKTTNTRMADVVQDPAITMNRKGGYNILTGQGGGGF